MVFEATPAALALINLLYSDAADMIVPMLGHDFASISNCTGSRMSCSLGSLAYTLGQYSHLKEHTAASHGDAIIADIIDDATHVGEPARCAALHSWGLMRVRFVRQAQAGQSPGAFARPRARGVARRRL